MEEMEIPWWGTAEISQGQQRGGRRKWEKAKQWKAGAIWDAEGVFQIARSFCTQVSVRDNKTGLTARMGLQFEENSEPDDMEEQVLMSGVVHEELRVATENKSQLYQ